MEKVKKRYGTIQVLLWIGHVLTSLVQHHGFKLHEIAPRLAASPRRRL